MNANLKPWPVPPDPREAIRERAKEIYIRSGKIPGRDAENWAQAEQEILRESAIASTPRVIVVKVDGVQYFGQYIPESSDGYVPGEFGPGAPVPLRFHAGKMFVKRPNGKILETTIVNKIS